MCREVYTIMHSSTSNDAEIAAVPPEIVSSTFTSRRKLLVGPKPKKVMGHTDSIKCETDTSEIFYITKGRSVNSVYLMNRTSYPDGDVGREYLVLDANFQNDIDLISDFQSLAFEELKKRNISI